MSNEAAVPPSLIERIRKIAQDEVAKFARSGFLRNAKISGGDGLTITAGSKLYVEHPDGHGMMLAGVYDFFDTYRLPDGSPQPMFLLARQDHTNALVMYDPTPDASKPGGYAQFVAILDRAQNIIVGDDADSGTGLARPYVPVPFYPARYADMTVSTTSSTFETLYQAVLYKQHPKLLVGVQHTMDTSGTTGEVRVLVNGVQFGSTWSSGYVVASDSVYDVVAGDLYSALTVEIQGRRTSATGALRVTPSYLYGLQS